MLFPKDAAQKLNKVKRDLLIRHIDGPQCLTVHQELQMRSVLVESKMLRPCTPDGAVISQPPARFLWTSLTDYGRDVLGYVLGDYADKLVAAGFLTEAPSIEAIKGSLKDRAYGSGSMIGDPNYADQPSFSF